MYKMINSDNDFSDDSENVLENIRINATIVHEYHRRRYLYYKNQIKYFRIPVLIFSAVNSVASVGIPSKYLAQENISLINCFLSLVCGIICSIELFIGITTALEKEMVASREFYGLAIDIYKVLSLKRENRNVKAHVYLNDKFTLYEKLVEQSNILETKMKDLLTPVNKSIYDSENSITSSNNSGIFAFEM